MNPITHYLISFAISSNFTLSKKERTLTTISGIIPDIDGIGIIAELISKKTNYNLNWWSEYHHVLAHNITFAIIISLFVFILTRKIRCFLLSFFIFHIHLFCDIIGGRGPDGFQWPIDYLYPFSNKLQLVWYGQWQLNSWQNIVITIIFIIITIKIAIKKNISPIEIFSEKYNKIVILTIKNRFKN